MRGKYTFPEGRWKRISKSAKDLIERMLTMDPKLRISAEEAYRHPWINDACKVEPIDLNIIESLGKFNVSFQIHIYRQQTNFK